MQKKVQSLIKQNKRQKRYKIQQNINIKFLVILHSYLHFEMKKIPESLQDDLFFFLSKLNDIVISMIEFITLPQF